METKTLKGICPEIDEILKDTSYCIIYQEQVMQIVHKVFGMTMGQADMFRRAIGKKDPVLMQKMISELQQKETNLNPEDVQHIVETIAACSGYLFNKSHSAAYAYTAYQTLFLKTFYPSEFYCALLNSDIDAEKTSEYIFEAKCQGIPIYPPDAYLSDKKWKKDKEGGLRYGLEKIKNVGKAEFVYPQISADMTNEQKLIAFMDANPTVNKQVVISMGKALCFGNCPTWVEMYVDWFKKAYSRKQECLERIEKFQDNPKKVSEWTEKMNSIESSPSYFEDNVGACVDAQTEVLGFSFLNKITAEYDTYLADNYNDINIGELSQVRYIKTRAGKPMLSFTLTDRNNFQHKYVMFRNIPSELSDGIVVNVKEEPPNPYKKNSGFNSSIAKEVSRAKKL